MRKNPNERTRVVGARWHDVASIGTAVIEPASCTGANPSWRRNSCCYRHLRRDNATKVFRSFASENRPNTLIVLLATEVAGFEHATEMAATALPPCTFENEPRRCAASVLMGLHSTLICNASSKVAWQTAWSSQGFARPGSCTLIVAILNDHRQTRSFAGAPVLRLWQLDWSAASCLRYMN